MIRVSPIIFTANTDSWRTILEALGAVVVIDSPGWVVYRAGVGQVALHASEESRSTLWFESDTPEASARALAGARGEVTSKPLDGGDTGYEVRFANDVVPGFSSLGPVADGADPELSLMPLWHTPNLDGAKAALAGAGLQVRITSDSGGWADYRADDGLVAVHRAHKPRVEVSFEYSGDLDELAQRLRGAGVSVRDIDETFGRTLRIDDPDGGNEIWVNSVQDDLYGYTLH